MTAAAPAPSDSAFARMIVRLVGAISTKSTERGAARQRLETQRAGAGEEIEHARIRRATD